MSHKGKRPAKPARLIAIGLAIVAAYSAATTAQTGHAASVANPPRCVVVRIPSP